VRARGVGFDGNAGFNVTVCLPDRSPRKVVSLQLLDRTRKMPYWVARNDFVEVGVGVLKGRGGGAKEGGWMCACEGFVSPLRSTLRAQGPFST
jgi:hypothetical protein